MCTWETVQYSGCPRVPKCHSRYRMYQVYNAVSSNPAGIPCFNMNCPTVDGGAKKGSCEGTVLGIIPCPGPEPVQSVESSTSGTHSSMTGNTSHSVHQSSTAQRHQRSSSAATGKSASRSRGNTPQASQGSSRKSPPTEQSRQGTKGEKRQRR